jgi:hypothetical protein
VDLRQHGDPVMADLLAPLADAGCGTVVELYEHFVRHQLALTHDGWPPAVRAWWEKGEPLPYWTDPDQMRRGAAVAERWLPEIVTSYLVASLPSAYAGAKGARAIRRISLLGAADPWLRRVLETLVFVLRVDEPGGLEVGGTGYTLARTTRIFHGLARVMITDHQVDRSVEGGIGEPWDAEHEGVPANQEDMLGTLWTFALTPLDVIEGTGIRLSEADKDAVVHRWCVVGHLLGIGAGLDEPLLPMTHAEAAASWARIRAEQFAASEDGRFLTGVLLDRCRRLVPVPGLRNLPAASVYDNLGPAAAGYVGVARPGPVRHLLGVTKAFVWLTAHVPGGRLLVAPLRSLLKRYAVRWLRQEREGGRPAVVVPEEQRRCLMPMYMTPRARRALRA